MTSESELQRAVDRLTLTIDQLRQELVRKDVYDADKQATGARIGTVERDVEDLDAKVDKAEERRAADRRLILTALVLPVLVFVIQLYVAAQIGGPA